MGWTFTHREKGVTTERFFTDRFNYSNENGYGKVIACKAYPSEAYIAFELCHYGAPVETIALVVLTRYVQDYYNFGYKDMEENCGPYYYNCPQSILDLLSPTTNTTAAVWREKCREMANRRQELRNLKAPCQILIGMDRITLLERCRGYWVGQKNNKLYKFSDRFLGENKIEILTNNEHAQ